MKININMNRTHATSFNNECFIIVVTIQTQLHFQSHLKPETLKHIFIVTPCMLSSYSIIIPITAHTGCFTTLGHNCRR